MQTTRQVRRGVTMLAIGLLGTAPAHAGGNAWEVVDVVPSGPGPDGPTRASLKVRVSGVPAPRVAERAEWALRDARGGRRGIEPSRVVPYATSNETLALVVLVEGHEYYFGNRHYTVAVEHPEAATRRPVEGIFDSLRSALDAPATNDEIPETIRNAGPPGSQGSLIVYADTADVRMPMGDLRRLDGAALGAQELQRGRTRRDLAAGLQAAQAALHRASAARKVLVVISDGVNPDGLDGVVAVKRQLDRDRVEVVALHLEVPIATLPVDAAVRRAARRVMEVLGGEHYRKVSSPRELSRQLAGVVRAPINARFWLEFPGGPTPSGRLPRGPDWDGESHDLVLLRNGEPFTAGSIAAVLPSPPSPSSGGWWWPAVPLAALGLAGVASAVALARRRARSAPVAPPLAPLAPPLAPPSTPAALLIPLDGPLQTQSFRVDGPWTRLGTGDDVDVRFVDPAMSRDHAAIERTPAGFMLIDRGSTNGTRVNTVRVDRQLLVDDDVITLGATRCRFRTMNG